MKIMFYINSIHEGGAERVVVNLANTFSKDDHVILVTSYRDVWEYPYESTVNRIILYEDKIKNPIKRNIGLISRLREVIKSENPDVLITFMGEANIRACISKLGLKTKLIISVRNDPKKEYPGIIGKICAKFILPIADGCVFQTEDAKLFFGKKIRNNSKIILNAVNPKFFEVENTSIDNRRNIVTCGRLVPQKNYMMLLRAFNRIKNDISSDLLIYGDGDLKEQLMEYIKDNDLEQRVFLMGQTNNVIESIKNARVFVLSSDFEGLPNALLEAMAMGIPSISTDCPCGGPKTVITNMVDGILTPVGDEVEMAKNLYLLNVNNELANTISISTKKKAISLFCPDVINKEWYSYFQKVCN